MTYTPKSFTPSSFTASNEPKESIIQKAGSYAPGTMGTVGAAAGEIGGPVGSGAGAFIGTMAGKAVQDITTPKPASHYTTETEPGFKIGPIGFGIQTKDHSNAGFAKLTEEGKQGSFDYLKDSLKDAEIAAATAWAGSKYLKNIFKVKGIFGKVKNILPSEQLAQAGGEKTAQAAANTVQQIAKTSYLDDIVKAAQKANDPVVTNQIKSILTNGLDKQTTKLVKDASLSELKNIVLNNPEVVKNIPTTMVEALTRRTAMSNMASWKNIIQKIITGSNEPGKSEAAKIIRNALNTQLKNVPGVNTGDIMVQLGKIGTKYGLPYIAGKTVLKKVPGFGLFSGGE